MLRQVFVIAVVAASQVISDNLFKAPKHQILRSTVELNSDLKQIRSNTFDIEQKTQRDNNHVLNYNFEKL